MWSFGQHEHAVRLDQEPGAQRDVGGGIWRSGEHRGGAGLDRRAERIATTPWRALLTRSTNEPGALG